MAGARLGALLRAPALHFLVLGALLAGLDAKLAWLDARQAETASPRPPIHITAARVAEIRDEYQRTVQVVPTAAEVDALVARDADEEMLYREALLLGLDRGDRAVKWRIVEKMHFLYGEEAGDPDTAYERGLALGLERDDIVVRNTMVTKMRLLAKAASRSDEPTGDALDRALEEYLRTHPRPYARSTRVSLVQVYLSADKHGTALDADARALRQRLVDAPTAPEAAIALGDPFVPGSAFRLMSPSGFTKIFGEGFASAIAGLAPGRWSEPIASPYGLHLVWVTGREAADLPALATVRSRVLRAYRADRRAAYLARMMDELRAAYTVTVERAAS